MTGIGFPPSCDFIVAITDPAGSVTTMATHSDAEGNFAADYVLVDGIKDLYRVAVLDDEGTFFAGTGFTDAVPCALTVDPSQPEAGSNFQTIQHAVNNLPNPGPCTVTVKAGTYHENVAISAKNTLATSDAQRIVIQADAPLSVTIDPSTLSGTVTGCGGGGSTEHAFRICSGTASTITAFMTLKGFVLTGATDDAITLFSASGAVFAGTDITIEGNDIHHNGGAAAGGVSIGAVTPRTWIVNNLIRSNGRHGVSFASNVNPTYIVNNTLYQNGWSGVTRPGSTNVFLINNLFVGNGTVSGGTGNCSCGLGQVSGGTTASITLRNNMFYKNGPGASGSLTNVNDISDPTAVLDAGDSGNFTTTGHANNTSSTTTGIAACTFGDCAATHAFTEIFVGATNFHLKTTSPVSPAIDNGVNSFVNGSLEWVPSTGNTRDFAPQDDFEGDVRPQRVAVDIGYDEAPPTTGTLVVKKHVVNDNGGSSGAADFTLHVKKDGADVSGSPAAGSESGTSYTLLPGTYVVSEDASPSGYGASFSGDCDGTGSVTVVAGETKTCTLTNDDIAPKVIVIKKVVNDSGGTAAASAFTMTVTGTAVPGPNASNSTSVPGAESPGTTITLRPGSYSVTESGPSGYAQSNAGDCTSVTVALGDTKTCTVTNDDIAPKLTVIKHVVNDNGGGALPSAFTMTVAGTAVPGPNPSNSTTFSGAESPGTTITLRPGSYSVTESGPGGYAQSNAGDCTSVTVAVGDTKTCTVTNDDIPPKLTVIKHVITDNGGTALASAFTMTVSGTAVPGPNPSNSTTFSGAESPGTTLTLRPGSYSVTESGPSGYDQSNAGDCTSVTVALGDTKTCTVTNDDIQPKLIVIKHVVNDNGGGKAAADFTITVTGNSPDPASFQGEESPGTTVMLNKGTYSVDEAAEPGYTKTLGDDCSGSIDIGQTKTCQITNDDLPLGPASLWVSLKASDDLGTQFDVEVRVYHSLSDPVDSQIATGLTRCITGVVRSASLATEVAVTFDKAASEPLAIRIFTRIGTNADGTKCTGPGGSHNSAAGLRLYYDSTSRPSQVGDEPLYLHAPNLTHPTDFLDSNAPTTTTTKQRDSAGINFSQSCTVGSLCPYGTNPWQQIGSGWTE